MEAAKILVVDDEPRFWSVKEALNQWGYHVTTAASATRRSGAEGELFDAAHHDIRMPDMSGSNCCAR